MDYWQEALECALDEAGAFGKLTEEEIKAVAHSLEMASEMKSEVCGSYHIPNPSIKEKEELEKRHQRELKDKENEINTLKNLIGYNYKIDPNKIGTYNDRVNYYDGRIVELY
jgi:hypothetical protein